LIYQLCDGDSVEVNVLNGIVGGLSPYTLNSPEQSFYTAGNYLITGLDSNGCVIERNLEVLAWPLPTVVELSSVPVSALAAGTASVVATTIADSLSILWQTGQTDFSIDVSTEGTYSFVLTDSNGCQTDSSVVVNFNSVLELTHSNDWFIRNHELVYKGTSTLVNVGIYNVVGQQVMNLAVVAPGQRISLETFASQVFLVKSNGYVARVSAM